MREKVARDTTHVRTTITETIARIHPLSDHVRRTVEALLDEKTKPRGSLGRLEGLVSRIAAIRGDVPPRHPRAALVVAAADHGVAAEGVSAYPQSVTAEMLANFDAPSRDWSSKRANPTIDLFLYDIREDLSQRQAGYVLGLSFYFVT